MKEGRKPEYPEKTPGDELQYHDGDFLVIVRDKLARQQQAMFQERVCLDKLTCYHTDKGVAYQTCCALTAVLVLTLYKAYIVPFAIF